jgi:hypothetical protein
MVLRTARFAQHGVLLDHASHERGGADLVDAARQDFGVVEDAAEGIVGKQGFAQVAGHVDAVADVGDDFGQTERAEMVTDAEALVEGFIHRQLQRTAQLEMSDEQEHGQGLAVHLVAADQAQLFEYRLVEQVGLPHTISGLSLSRCYSARIGRYLGLCLSTKGSR